jgi:hypothetical protein
MAENRGGANGGPQYSPINVSPSGGAGQSGTKNLNYTGMPYGQNQATNQNRIQGNAAVAKTVSPKTPPPALVNPMTEVRPVTAPSDFPDEDITTGSISGTTPGPESLMMPSQQEEPNDPDLDLVREYFPVIELWASQVDTSQGTKDYVNYLRSIL